MKLYILRHAIAAPRGVPGLADAERPLTARGIHKMKAAAQGMRAMEMEFDRILSSPFRRARQTAEIVAGAFDLDVEIRESLAPSAPPRQLVADLIAAAAGRRRSGRILVVGHQPHLGAVVSLLVSGGDRVRIELKKGALCQLRIDPDASLHAGRCATLDWLMTPWQLRRQKN